MAGGGGQLAQRLGDFLSLITPRTSAPRSPSSDRAREVAHATWSARLSWIALHAAALAVLLVVDSDLSRARRDKNYWYLSSYWTLLLATVVSYFYTAGSTPGYADAMQDELREYMPKDAETLRTPTRSASASSLVPSSQLNSQLQSPPQASTVININDKPYAAGRSQPSLEKGAAGQSNLAVRRGGSAPDLSLDGSLEEKVKSFRSIDHSSSPLCEQTPGENSPLLDRGKARGLHVVVAEDPGTSDMNATPAGAETPGTRYNRGRRCPYCQVWQPLRTKHCHECDRCVLRFDHHCFWVGTCVGLKNHCRFWWYLLLETTLAVWTLEISTSAFTWKETPDEWMSMNLLVLLDCLLLVCFVAFLVALLCFHSYLIVTAQTTYETTRRKRIPYLRHVPDNVYPFSKDVWTNIVRFCWTPTKEVMIYELPSAEELEARASTVTWYDNQYYSCC